MSEEMESIDLHNNKNISNWSIPNDVLLTCHEEVEGQSEK